MKDAGNLDRLVVIRKAVSQQTASGQMRHMYITQRTCYAHRLASQNRTGGERYEADQLVEVRDVQWIIRATDAPVDASMVLTYGNYTYWITKVEEFQLKNRPSRNSFLLLNTELRDNE